MNVKPRPLRQPLFNLIIATSLMMVSGCAAYNMNETPVKEYDFSVVRDQAERSDFIKAFGEPGKTSVHEDKTIEDEWLLSIKNYPDEPTFQKALHYASVGMYNVLDHPTKTGVNRKTLKLLTAKFNENSKLTEAYIENVCYWGCK